MVSKLLCGLACLMAQCATAAVSETDYLGDVPNVISVSRLAQTQDDTPGAVTILERDFIRQSGARTVVDVLRFVPGFQTTTSFEADAPVATYHGRNDDWANRVQVLVDGRSVYSGLLQGSAGIGWQTLALDDIERIEVLRGSNSATYGARAFLGVVNIISRDVRETNGSTSVSTLRGENGVADIGLSHSWSAHDASFRLSVDSVGDEGLTGAFGHNHTERLNFCSHFALEQGAELDLRAGGLGIYAGRGSLDPTQFGNPARQRFMGSQFVQVDWRRALDDSQDLSVSASHTENTLLDRYLFGDTGSAYFGAPVDASGTEYVDSITVQDTRRWSPVLRTVWGAEFRHEKVDSPPLFDLLHSVSNDFYRLFGSAEWRLRPDLLLNAGALAEHNAFSGDAFSPRLMLNWTVAPGHTLRAGASTAFRPPSAYEKYAQVRFRDANGQNPTGYFTFNNGSLQAERLLSQELGYHLAPVESALSGDVRLFQERVSGGIAHTEIEVAFGANPESYLNSNTDKIQGLEFQINWAPAPGSKLMLTQSWTEIHSDNIVGGSNQFRTEHGAPRYAASLAWMQRLAAGWQLAMLYSQADEVALLTSSTHRILSSTHRSDVRLAKELKIGGKRAEIALLVQALDGPTQDGDSFAYFQRRALLGLKLDF